MKLAMSMRCVSKCFIGRPFRVYSVLFLGVIVGFALSTMLQTLTLQRTRTALKLQQVVDYRALDGSKRVEFSNLEGRYDAAIDLGEYDYERMVFGEQDGGAAPDAYVKVNRFKVMQYVASVSQSTATTSIESTSCWWSAMKLTYQTTWSHNSIAWTHKMTHQVVIPYT